MVENRKPLGEVRGYTLLCNVRGRKFLSANDRSANRHYATSTTPICEFLFGKLVQSLLQNGQFRVAANAKVCA